MNAWMPDLIPWIDVLGRSLLHFFWQGAVVGLLYWLLRSLCTGVEARYRLGMAALLALLACPLATLLWLQPSAAVLVGAEGSTQPILGSAIAATATQLASGAQLQISIQQALPWFVGLWLAGVCLIATRSFLHWRRLARAVRAASVLPREWQMRLIQLRQRFGILRPVRLLVSIQIATPTLIGWIKPAILLPASLLSGFTPNQIELIIAHELSHVRRFDYLANLAQVAIETLLFYHPVVHWISRDVRQAREQCCDDLVLTLGGGNAVAYARTLADLEELQHDFGHAVPALGVGGGVLFTRIRRIVDPLHTLQIDAVPRGNGLTLPMLVAFAGFALFAVRAHLMPVAAVGEAVRQIPAQSMALLSGNAQLAATRPLIVQDVANSSNTAVLPTAVPGGDAAERTAASVDTAEQIVDRLAQPRIVLAPPQFATARVANLHTHIDFARPPIAVAPAAADDPPAASVEAPRPVVADPRLPVPDQVVQPRYPLEALQGGTTGKVDLGFRIGTDGSVRDIRVLHAQPSGIFEQAAIAALRQWHFSVPSTADASMRYARSFAFTRADSKVETCLEVTGSHICRHAGPENGAN